MLTFPNKKVLWFGGALASGVGGYMLYRNLIKPWLYQNVETSVKPKLKPQRAASFEEPAIEDTPCQPDLPSPGLDLRYFSPTTENIIIVPPHLRRATSLCSYGNRFQLAGIFNLRRSASLPVGRYNYPMPSVMVQGTSAMPNNGNQVSLTESSESVVNGGSVSVQAEVMKEASPGRNLPVRSVSLQLEHHRTLQPTHPSSVGDVPTCNVSDLTPFPDPPFERVATFKSSTTHSVVSVVSVEEVYFPARQQRLSVVRGARLTYTLQSERISLPRGKSTFNISSPRAEIVRKTFSVSVESSVTYSLSQLSGDERIPTRASRPRGDTPRPEMLEILSGPVESRVEVDSVDVPRRPRRPLPRTLPRISQILSDSEDGTVEYINLSDLDDEDLSLHPRHSPSGVPSLSRVDDITTRRMAAYYIKLRSTREMSDMRPFSEELPVYSSGSEREDEDEESEDEEPPAVELPKLVLLKLLHEHDLPNAVAKIFKGEYNGQTVAVKRIELKRGTGAHAYNYVKEAQMSLQLQHPFIVRSLAVRMEVNTVNLVQEYLQGDLTDVILNPLDRVVEVEARFILACCVGGLTYLHAHDIVHCDLKPDNILVDWKGYVKLCDFGLTTVVKRPKSSRQFRGTPGYAAPEFLFGETYGKPSDIWSMGATMFCLMNEYMPYNYENPVREEYERAPPFDFAVSVECQTTLINMMHFDPVARETIESLVRDSWVSEILDDVWAFRVLSPFVLRQTDNWPLSRRSRATAFRFPVKRPTDNREPRNTLPDNLSEIDEYY